MLRLNNSTQTNVTETIIEQVDRQDSLHETIINADSAFSDQSDLKKGFTGKKLRQARFIEFAEYIIKRNVI